MQYLTLNDGNKMPILGYGVYRVEPAEAQRCVEDAISVGCRLIDTAQTYHNEEGVGAAVKAAIAVGVKREELFITTKLWVSDVSEDRALKAFDASMKKLRLDYLDLYLIHQPYSDTYGAWRAMSRLKKEGRIRSIGVSNFNPGQIMDFAINNEIKPAKSDRVQSFSSTTRSAGKFKRARHRDAKLGAVWRGQKGYVWQRGAKNDRAEARQERGSSDFALARAARYRRHPKER